MSKFELGVKVRCKVTGFTGILISRIEYINGCVQYCIKPAVGKDNKMPDGEYLDQEQIELVDKKPVKVKATPTGGAQMDCPKG